VITATCLIEVSRCNVAIVAADVGEPQIMIIFERLVLIVHRPKLSTTHGLRDRVFHCQYLVRTQ
jgi:hypothetical protein